MNTAEAIALVGRWPADRSVPGKLAAAIANAQGDDAWQMGMMVEALMVASTTMADYDMINRCFPLSPEHASGLFIGHRPLE